MNNPKKVQRGNTRSPLNYNPFKKAAMNMQSIVADQGLKGDIEDLRKLKSGGKRGDGRNSEAEPEPLDTQEHITHGDHLAEGEKRPMNPVDHSKSSPVQPNKIGGDMEEQHRDKTPPPHKTPEAKSRQLLNRSAGANDDDNQDTEAGEDNASSQKGRDNDQDSRGLSAVERLHRGFNSNRRDKRIVTPGKNADMNMRRPQAMLEGTDTGKTKSRETAFMQRDKKKNYEQGGFRKK